MFICYFLFKGPMVEEELGVFLAGGLQKLRGSSFLMVGKGVSKGGWAMRVGEGAGRHQCL
jgi:hypothetical protein